MSDDEEPSGKRTKVKTKRVLRRGNTAPMKASKKNRQQPSITLPEAENNFASQFHTLDEDDVDPARTAQQEQMERKLAKLRSKTRLNQRKSAPTTPRGGRGNRQQQPKKRSSASTTTTSTRTTTTTFGRSQTDIDAFDDSFFTGDPFADFPNDEFAFSAPDLMAGATAFSAPNASTVTSFSASSSPQPPAVARPSDPLPVAVAAAASSAQSYTQPLAKPTPSPQLRASNSNPMTVSGMTELSIANEKAEPLTIPLAPPAPSDGNSSLPPKRAATRPARANTLPTLPMSDTSNVSAPVAVTTDEREIRLDFDPFDTVERPPLRNDDSSDLTMFYSYSAPASRRTSQSAAEQRTYVPYVHPAGVDTRGRSSMVYVPGVQVPMYNVAGGVPYVNGHQAAAGQAGVPPGYAYGQTAPGGQWVQAPQQYAQYPARQYPMTPPPGQQW